ncbi:hypothetical protein ACOXXX_13505 [Thalassococcus sp. BH17M4-6]|uniref:hypothetical protein n=1 Tax=Thalassococcus sp. BH17M4-6 TaxID=3413148 RepID=UPI003BD59287
MMRKLLCCLALIGLTACADGARELKEPAEPLGDMKLGHAIVVAPNIVKGPLSRDATDEEWIASLDNALEERFRRYQGDKFYHIGVSIEGYVLAQPGVPLVLSPKSVLILNATVWDDAAGKKLNTEPEQITVLEAVSPNTIVGSGLTQSKAVQLRVLSANAALKIEQWMRKMQKDKGWFGGPEADAVTAARIAAEAPAEEEAAADAPQTAETALAAAE